MQHTFLTRRLRLRLPSPMESPQIQKCNFLFQCVRWSRLSFHVRVGRQQSIWSS